MVFRGTGYNYSQSDELFELMKHRQRQLEALSIKARRDDDAHELEREMAELDRDIAAGIEELDRMEAVKRARKLRELRRRVNNHR